MMEEHRGLPEIKGHPTTFQKHFRRIVLSGGLIAACAIGWLCWKWFDHPEMGVLGEELNPIVFFTLMALLPAIGIPATPLYLVAGSSYEKSIALLGTLIAIAANQTLCYWLARSAMRPVVARLLNWADIRLPEVEKSSELQFTILVKLTPGVPVFAKNYLLGLAQVSFTTFFPISLLIAGIYAGSFVMLGKSFLEDDPWTGALAVLLLVLINVAGFWWFKRNTKC